MKPTKPLLPLAAAAALALTAAVETRPAAAQDAAPPATGAPAEIPPAGSVDAAPEQVDPGPPIGSPGDAADDSTLSDRLSESGGVIEPAQPGADPGMVRPPPDGGTATTPVIPPPGTPGGDPSVRPQ